MTLDVLGVREDKYHNIRSVMQTITLHDDVTVTLGTKEPWQIRCEAEGVPLGEENLCWRAAKTYFDRTRTDPDGLRIDIVKRIPMEAGLAGGSADAAAVLRALNQLDGNRFELGELCAMAESVGSDVPFCLLGGTALAEGRGEELMALPAMPACFFVVCKPAFSNSTKELYQRLDRADIVSRPKTEELIQALQQEDLAKIASLVKNVFEPLVAEEHLELRRIETILGDCGSLGSCMTGTGSAVYGIFPDFELAAMASMTLMEKGYQTFLAKPV